jgi:S1-C subfamily serine protease
MRLRPGSVFIALVLCSIAGMTDMTQIIPAIPAQQILPATGSKEEKIAQLNKSIFCLSVINPRFANPPRRAIGTGFLVTEKLLATAYHVKEDLDRQANQAGRPPGKIIAWKKFEDGEYVEIPLSFVQADAAADIAVFTFPAETLNVQAQKRNLKPLPLAARLPSIGEDILSVGYYGLMDFPFNSLGNVSTIDKGEDIYSDMTLMPGNSGSPLISLKTGEVLGINVKVMTIGDGTMRLGISKRIAKLIELLDKNK